MNIERRLDVGLQKPEGYALVGPRSLERCWLCDKKQDDELPEIGLCPACRRELRAA